MDDTQQNFEYDEPWCYIGLYETPQWADSRGGKRYGPMLRIERAFNAFAGISNKRLEEIGVGGVALMERKLEMMRKQLQKDKEKIKQLEAKLKAIS